MSGKSGGSKVRVKIPKVRRNSGEVRPYNELPRASKVGDQLLLWGTAFGLLVVMLGGVGLMWREGRAPASPVSVETSTALKPGRILEQARQEYISGHYEQAAEQARVALALELATPSQPSLEADARRLLGLSYEQGGKPAQAYPEWKWLKEHGGRPEDVNHYRLASQRLGQAAEQSALEQLREAQTLLTRNGQEQLALTQAQRALALLQAHRSSPRAQQSAHLLVANVALQQNRPQLALESLNKAAQLGPLNEEQRVLRARLKRVQAHSDPAPSGAQVRQMQVRVVIPQLADGPAYPKRTQGSLGSHPSAGRKQPVPTDEEEQEVRTAGPLPPRPAAPKLELPKLELPNQGEGSSLPGYQDRSGDTLPSYRDQSGSSLPGYSQKSRARDTLPGY